MSEVPGLPSEGPATLEGVRDFLRITDATDDDRITAVVAAVNARVRTWPCCDDSADVETPAEAEWTANVVEGATMLSGRLFRRRESPAGVAAFGEMGPVYVMRNDPDVAMLLSLGTWARPQVG
jgi:hypothetical protein